MNRRARLLLPIAFLALATVSLFVWNNFNVGQVLDVYRGIPVRDNGLLFVRSHGKHYSPGGYYYGQKWQCVEYIKRFYLDAKGHKMPETMGHAKSFFDENLPDGATNRQRDLIQYRNGSTAKPQPDDLLVFTDTKYGHVGIVSETVSNYVEIVQQNIFGRTRQRFSLVASNGHFHVTEPRRPAGWLRIKESSPPK